MSKSQHELKQETMKENETCDLVRIETTVCQYCLDGKGEECHTPGCALFLHAVDMAWIPEMYTVLKRYKADD